MSGVDVSESSAVPRHNIIDQAQLPNGETSAVEESHDTGYNGRSDGLEATQGSANLHGSVGLSAAEDSAVGVLHRRQASPERRSHEREYCQREDIQRNAFTERTDKDQEGKPRNDQHFSNLATQLYVISYLILFSFLGTLARLGLQAITFYPGAPVVFSELWANVVGSFFMGFLSEDRMLFKEGWGTPTYHQQLQKKQEQDAEGGSASDQTIDLAAAKKAHAAVKKTIPLYIGLATGFCGCFTSFSSFIRDMFLALSNDLPTPLNHPADFAPDGTSAASTVPRNGGYSVMALLGVIFITVALCISALHVGAHVSNALKNLTPGLPFNFCRKFLDPIAVFLAWGCWLGAILLTVLPPDRHSARPEIWRGRAVFALVFAPLGCLGRFYASLYLNGKISSFPLGTFVVNILGTAILGLSYDLQHAPLGGVIGCQVLQGIQDGLCGCLTTVSTWVSELSSLRRKHAYRYGTASVVTALVFLIIIMGSLRWTKGFSELQCVK